MKRRLRVAQIGTAHDHAADHIDTLRSLSDEFELVGVCEPDPALREAAAHRKSYDGLRLSYEGLRWLSMDEALDMKDLDAVIIETSEAELVPCARRFAERGLPIHMDKPCGFDYPSFAALVELMRGKRLPLHIGYMYRYNEAVQHCLALKEEGRLGEIFSVEAQMSVLHTPEKRRWLERFPGGMMFFLGCHLVDLIYLFCGEPEEVIPFNTSTHTDGVDSLDFGFALFRYENGLSFAKTCAVEVNGFDRRQLVINGTRGSVRVEPIERRTGGPDVETIATAHVTFHEDGMAHPFGSAGEDVTFGPFGRYLEMMRDFAAIVHGERENRFDYDYELAVQRLLLRACGL